MWIGTAERGKTADQKNGKINDTTYRKNNVLNNITWSKRERNTLNNPTYTYISEVK